MDMSRRRIIGSHRKPRRRLRVNLRISERGLKPATTGLADNVVAGFSPRLLAVGLRFHRSEQVFDLLDMTLGGIFIHVLS